MKSLSRIYRNGNGEAVQRMEFRDLDELEEQENGVFLSPEEEFEEGDGEEAHSGEENGSEPESEKGSEFASENGDATSSGYSEEDVESIRAEAYDQGRQEGVEEGHARGKEEGRAEKEQELDQTVQALAEALERINGLRSHLLNANKRDMVRLVRTIAEQVIHAEASTSESAILRVVERAIQSSVQSEEYRIRVNPEDMSVVTENKPLFLASMSGLQNIVFESDEEVSRGGCVVESDLGKVDATIETQLEKIQEQLMAEVASEDA
jgi:flagellar assembly protein FliH